jgi:hypothetical protein
MRLNSFTASVIRRIPHAFVEVSVEFIERFLLDALILPEECLWDLLVTVDDVVEFTSVTYFYLDSRNVED